MQLTLRLYDQSDADLVCLRLRYGKRFPRVVRDCVSAHLRGARSTVRFPEDVRPWAKRPRGHVDVNVTFDPERDAAAVEWLAGVRERAKGNVVKTIVRSMYDRFPSELFLPPYAGGGSGAPPARAAARDDPGFRGRMDAAEARAAAEKGRGASAPAGTARTADVAAQAPTPTAAGILKEAPPRAAGRKAAEAAAKDAPAKPAAQAAPADDGKARAMADDGAREEGAAGLAGGADDMFDMLANLMG